MRWNSFSKSVLFSAVVGLAVMPVTMIASPLVGQRLAIAIYLVAALVIYVAGMTSELSRGVRIAALAGLLGTAVVVSTGSVTQIAAGLAIVLAVCRSGFLYRTAPGRAVLIEACLGLVSLLVAEFLFGASLLSLGLAVWAFMLVQSVFFLVGGVQARKEQSADRDPFEVAHSRAMEIIEQI